MQELTKEQKLTALVLSTCTNKNPRYCALYRAVSALEVSELTQVLQELNYTEVETGGIMDGWDMSFGRWTRGGLFREFEGLPGYSEGYTLGQKLYRMVFNETA